MSATFFSPIFFARILRMLGQVMPMICRKKVTMLFSEKSLGICTPLRSPSSQPRKPLIRWVPKLSKNCEKPWPSPFIRLLAKPSGSSMMSRTTFLILATTAQNAAGAMPRSSSSPSMMNLTGSSRKRPTAATIRPMRPPAFLRSSAISARTSSTAWLERSMRSLLKASRAAITSFWRVSSWPSNFFCSSAAEPCSEAGSSPKILATRAGDDEVAGGDDRVHLGRDRRQLLDHAVGEILLGPIVRVGRPAGQARDRVPEPDDEAAGARMPLVDALLDDLEVALELSGEDGLCRLPLRHGVRREVLQQRLARRLRLVEGRLGLGAGLGAHVLLGADHAFLAGAGALDGALARRGERLERLHLEARHVGVGLAGARPAAWRGPRPDPPWPPGRARP